MADEVWGLPYRGTAWDSGATVWDGETSDANVGTTVWDRDKAEETWSDA